MHADKALASDNGGIGDSVDAGGITKVLQDVFRRFTGLLRAAGLSSLVSPDDKARIVVMKSSSVSELNSILKSLCIKLLSHSDVEV